MKKVGAVERLRCSFCNKDQVEVRKLIAGPTVFICNECVDVCVDIMRQELESAPPSVEAAAAIPAAEKTTAVVACNLCGLPVSRGEVVAISGRGFLCFGCCGEIEAALAERRENAPSDE